MTDLTRWDPFNEMMRLSTVMEQLFNNAFVPLTGVGRQPSIPIDVFENDEGYIVQAVAPGINPDQLDIQLNDQVLTIRGEWPQPQAQEGVTFHLRERATGRFERSIELPLPVNADGVQARYEYGILTLQLPKAESVRPRRISVQAQPKQLTDAAEPMRAKEAAA